MAWFTDRHCFLLAVTFYGLSTIYAVFLWRKGFRRDDWVNYFLLAAGVALHTLAMLKRGMTLHSCPVNNLYEATTFLLWALGLACLVYSLLPSIQRLELITFRLVVVGFALLTIGLLAGSQLPSHEGKPYFSDTKVLWSALLWLVYLEMLVAYKKFGRTSRRFAVGVVVAFILLLLTYGLTNKYSGLHQNSPTPAKSLTESSALNA